jgi:sodium transport system ATP-binding protein
VIEIRHLKKSYGSVAALRGISFTALNGTITGLVGENGAGKTTTLALTCGLIQPDEGVVQVGPGDPTPIERRRRIGALLDHRGLYDRLTARENITYFGRLHGLPPQMASQRVDAVIGQLGLEAIADRRTAGFSQGERMKVALGRAIVHSPGHLLLDEPTNGLDISAVRALRDILRRLRDDGVCIIFSSHVLDEIRALCDNVVMLSRGRIVADGDVSAICRQTQCATLEDAYLRLTGYAEKAS